MNLKPELCQKHPKKPDVNCYHCLIEDIISTMETLQHRIDDLYTLLNTQMAYVIGVLHDKK